MRRTRAALAVVAINAALSTALLPAAAVAREPEQVQLVAINDLHGRIGLTGGQESRQVTDPGPDGVYGGGAGSGRKNAEDEPDDRVSVVGGAAYIASTVQERQTDFRRQAGGSAASFFVGAGDLVGTSPPPSGDYLDEPTIDALNTMGLDVAAVGDDEFNRGTTELLRLSAATDGSRADRVRACQGVERGVTGCFGEGEHAFTGAEFPYLAANVVSQTTGEPILPPYQVFTTPLGQRIGIIGAVAATTPSLVPPEGITDVAFLDEAEAVNRWVPDLRDQGVEAIAVLLHNGGQQEGAAGRDPSGCDGLTGAVVTINQRIDPAVDVIVSGHTHGAYVCSLPVPGGQPRLVTQAGSYGKLVTDIRMTLDPGTGDVVRDDSYRATNVPVIRSDADPAVEAVVDYWTAGPGNEGGGDGEAAPDPELQSTGSTRSSADRSWLFGAGAVVVLLGLPLGVWLSRRHRY